MSSNDPGPGSREVAHRPFAAEFDDATLSYSESDEERAPNYVVTPTGLRVNRLFAVGVLTEVEAVNDDVLRGRVVDPTGAFVTYAGQYQPEAAAFLDRTEPPAFVALTGKARTFEPEDSDVVYTSVRPESINAVDADTRDRWVVSAAQSTLNRLAVFADALAADVRGDDLRDALLEAGVDESLAAGVPLAIDHYGTTRTYLEAVRRIAVDALELVGGERDSVRPLDVAPDEGGDAELGALPSGVGNIRAVSTGSSAEAGSEPAESEAVASAGVDSDAEATADSESASGSTPETTAEAASESAAEPASEATSEPASEPTTQPEPSEAAADVAGSTEGTAGSTAATGSDGLDDDDLGDFDAGGSADAGEPADAGGATNADELGDFEADESAPTEATAETAGDSEPETTDVDEDGMYELDDDERREIEAEYGTEFETGSEVDAAGEADIDVPSADELTDEVSGAPGDDGTAAADATVADAEAGDEASADEGESAEDAGAAEEAGATDERSADEGAVDEGTAEDEETPAPADVDVESVAVGTMDQLDDGDGVEREAVIDAVVDEYGVDPADVDDAIENALMSGRCYEPQEDRLKAI